MSKEEILINLRELSLEDKLFVLVRLSNLIKLQENEAAHREMIDKYVGTMKELVGDGFMTSQKRQEVQAKIVLATCLMEDGQSLTSTAHILGVDHSTVSHYKKVWKDASRYPKIYSDIISLYNKYKSALWKK